MTKMYQRIKDGSGWGFPGLSRKAHWFIDGESLSSRWLFLGKCEDDSQASVDDCKVCRRKLDKLKAEGLEIINEGAQAE